MIEEGLSYVPLIEAEKLGACLDDSYKAAGAAPFAILLFPVCILLAWIFLRFRVKSI